MAASQIAIDDQGNLPNHLDRKVWFTQSQLDYLEQQYPERTQTAQATDAELRHYSAQRSVILHIKSRVQR